MINIWWDRYGKCNYEKLILFILSVKKIVCMFQDNIIHSIALVWVNVKIQSPTSKGYLHNLACNLTKESKFCEIVSLTDVMSFYPATNSKSQRLNHFVICFQMFV